ncbi:MAG: hypothetical protein IT585_04755 [candidate division Zixibacteria bacterium]|nr:hypothetical protein [candidate division Zixibacteria bacterium]
MGNGNLVTTIEVKDERGRVVETKEVVTYAGLLNRAHQEGLKKVSTELIQAPSKGNEMTAICMAEVVTDKGTFRDYGDANPANVDSMIVPHIIRMAATRAKARAFRDAVNIGVVAIEELVLDYGNGVDNTKPKPNEVSHGKPVSNGRATSRNGPSNDRKETNQNGRSGNGTGSGNDPMTENQRRYLFRILAEHGITGDSAHDYLLQTFGAGSLKEVTKKEASDLIEELLANAQELLSGVAVS